MMKLIKLVCLVLVLYVVSLGESCYAGEFCEGRSSKGTEITNFSFSLNQSDFLSTDKSVIVNVDFISSSFGRWGMGENASLKETSYLVNVVFYSSVTKTSYIRKIVVDKNTFEDGTYCAQGYEKHASLSIDIEDLIDNLGLVNSNSAEIPVSVYVEYSSQLSFWRNYTDVTFGPEQSNPQTITIYKCNPGSIKFAANIPTIDANGMNVGLWYRDKSLGNIVVKNAESPSIFNGGGTQSIHLESSYENSGISNSSKKVVKENVDLDLSFNEILLNNVPYDAVDSLSRKVTYTTSHNTAITCRSSNIFLQSVAPLMLPPLRSMKQENEVNYICGEATEEYVTIPGQQVKKIVGSNNVDLTDEEDKYYDVRYLWQYKYADGSNNWTDVSGSESKSPDLSYPRERLQKKIYFRQKVKLALYDDKTLYASDEPFMGYVVYDVYKGIEKADFSITPTEYICIGSEFAEGKGDVVVTFNGNKEKYQYASVADPQEGQMFSYTWKKDNDLIQEKGNKVHCDGEVTSKVEYQVSVMDGCNNTVTLSTAKDVISLPELDPLLLVFSEQANVSLENHTIHMEKIASSDVNVTVKEEDRSKHKYYLLIANGKGEGGNDTIKIHNQYQTKISSEQWKMMVKAISEFGDNAVRFVKQSAQGCFSNEVPLIVTEVEPIYDNVIYFDQGSAGGWGDKMNICAGSGVPEVKGKVAKGGFSSGSYNYLWQYTTTPKVAKSWTQIPGTDKGSADLSENMLNILNQSIYIRRIVISSSGSSELRDTSATVEVNIFSRPSLRLLVSEKEGEGYVLNPSVNICYGGNLYFKAEMKDSSLLNTANYPDLEPHFYKYDSDGNDAEISNERMIGVDQPYKVRVTANFCDGKIVSDNEVKVLVGENLSMEWQDFSFSPCLVGGSFFDVGVLSPDPEYTYTFYDSNRKLLSEGAASIKIPEDNGHNNLHFYVVKQLGEHGCSQESKIVVEGNLIKSLLQPTKLRVLDNAADPVSGKYNVCAGMNFTVKPETEYLEISGLTYTWELDGILLKDTTHSVTINLDDYDKDHLLVRTSKRISRGKICDMIDDTVAIHTIPNVTVAEDITTSSDVICFGENVELSIKSSAVQGGTGNYTYTWSKYNEKTNKFELLGVDDQTDHIKDTKLTGNGIYQLKISDKKCLNEKKEGRVYRYQKTMPLVEIEVKPDLTIEPEHIKMTPTQFNLSDFSDGTTEIIVNVKDTVSAKLSVDTVVFYLENSLVAKKIATTNLNHNFIITKDMVKGSAIEFGIVRNITISKEKQCVSKLYSGKIEVNQGFTTSFEIASESGSEVIEECLEDDIILSVLSLPKFGDVVMPEGSYSYQWKRKRVNSMLWTEIADADKKSLSVKPDNNGVDYIYMCYLTYNNTSTSKVAISSNEILVKGYQKKSQQYVWAIENGNKSSVVEICHGQNLENLTLMFEDEESLHYQWQKMVDGSWVDILKSADVMGEEASVMTYSQKSVMENLYFRCVAIDYCDDTVPSKNFISVVVKKNTPVDPDLIFVQSNRIIPKGEDRVNSIRFVVPTDNANTYHWYYYPEKEMVGNDVTFKESEGAYLPDSGVQSYYIAGKHLLNVYKVNGNGCVSDTLQYSYELFDELRVQIAATVNKKPICPNSDVPDFSFGILDIIGGSGSSSIKWYFKTASMSAFLPLSSDAANFGYKISKDSSIVNKITNLSETTEFYAVVTSKNYPGEPWKSEVAVATVYERMTPGSIDPLEESVCYGTAPVIASIERADKGSGSYTYQWIQSEDQIKWRIVEGQGSYRYLSNYNSENDYSITKNTFFRRVVSDGCTRDTSLGTKMFSVAPRTRIGGDEIVGTGVVTKGESAFIYGKDKSFQYVFKKDDGISILDTVAGGHPFVSDKIQFNTRFYVSKIDEFGCESENDTSFLVVAARKMDGGKIVFNNGEKESWVCHNSRNVDILNESEPSGENLSFEWYYCKAGAENCNNSVMGKRSNAIVTSSEISLDTTGLLLTNETGKDVVYLFYRLVENRRMTIEGKDSVEYAYSDTIRLHVVPTLRSIEGNTIDGLAGELFGDTVACKGSSLPDLTYVVDPGVERHWRGIGACLYGSPMKFYWEYTEGVSVVDYNASSADWTRKQEVNYFESDIVRSCAIPSLDKSYTYRVTLDDGCSTISTNMVRLRAASYPEIYDSLFVIKSGVEEGDNVRINYNDDYNYGSYYWFRDALCSDTLAKNSTYVDMQGVDVYTSLYLKTSDIGGRGCMSEAHLVPLKVYKRSDGGKIAKDQTVCQGVPFDAIDNYIEASGSTGAFTYVWQVSNNKSTWSDIIGETSASLSEEAVNRVAIYGEQFFRRVAKNEFGKEVFSDTLRLGHYTPLKAGGISFEDNSVKNKFCQYDTIPDIITTMSTGGVSGDIGYPYKIGWEYSLGGELYDTLYDVSYSTGDKIYMSNLVSRLLANKDLDNQIYLKAHFVDERCGDVYGEPFELTVYQEAVIPSLYQEKDSCESNTVTVSVANKVDYTYRWFVLADSVEVWSDNNVYSKVISRNLGPDVTMYGVEASSVRTGCRSVPTYFNIDSLPDLSQEPLYVPSLVCYGADLDMEQEEAKGGSGEKTYSWQYSYDGVVYYDDPTNVSKNMYFKNVQKDVYLRRIVSDMCQSDTTEGVLIQSSKNIDFDYQVSVDDRHCKKEKIRVDLYLNEEVVLYADKKVYFFKESVYNENPVKTQYYFDETYLKKDADLSLSANGHGLLSVDEDSIRYVLVAYDSWTRCVSKNINYLTVYAATPVLAERSRISCENVKPCNETYVKIKGESGVDSAHEPIGIRYAWYTSKDAASWAKVLLCDSMDVEIQITDTIYVKRLTTNGCDTVESNILTFVGTPLVETDYNELLALSIVTQLNDTSSIVKVTVANNADFVTDGNDTVSVVKYGENILAYPAEMYKTMRLSLVKAGAVCYSQYRILPIEGGRIFMDGDGLVCKGNPLPMIKATETNGGKGNYTYQWQYRNEYVKEYVNIEGAFDETYQPDPAEVKTWYRRITNSGEYMAISNEVSIDLVPDVVVSNIIVENEDLILQNSLICNSEMVQKVAYVPLTLVDSVLNAEDGWWEYSADTIEWYRVWGSKMTDKDSAQKLLLNDSIDYRFYRYVAFNGCMSDTSKVIKVVTLNVPIIRDEEILITPSQCQGGYVSIDLCDYVTPSGSRMYERKGAAHRYMYTYRFENVGIHVSYYDVDNKVYKPYEDSSMVAPENKIRVDSVTEDVKVLISRIDMETKSVATRYVVIDYNPFDVDFIFRVNGQEYASDASNVMINQGDRIEFISHVEGADVSKVSYSWKLMSADNIPNALESDGYYSPLANPICYIYNAGNYPITLKASYAGCSQQVVCDAIYLPKSNVKKGIVGDVVFGEDEEVENRISSVNVYPNPCGDWLNVQAERMVRIELYDLAGSLLYENEGEEFRLDMRPLASGLYILVVDGEVFKIVKN